MTARELLDVLKTMTEAERGEFMDWWLDLPCTLMKPAFLATMDFRAIGPPIEEPGHAADQNTD